MNLKPILLAAILASIGVSGFAANYYVVVPLPGKQLLLNGISVNLSGVAMPAGVVGVPYAGFDLGQALQVSGDPAYSATNVSWSVVTGALPAGLTLNKGVISGTPTAAGAPPFTVRATYMTKTGEQAYSIFTLAITVALASGTLPQGVVGLPYPTYDLKPLLTVAGDPDFNPASVTWSVVSSTLPDGLTLKADGTIAGTPTVAGTGAVTARASYKGVNGEQTYQVVSLSIAVSLATATLPQAIVGLAYSYDLTPLLAVSGDAGYNGSNVTWSVTSGVLPAGLVLNAANGAITGTPTTASSGNVGVRAAYRGVNGEKTYQVVSLSITVSLGVATMPAAMASTSYLYDFKPLLAVTGDPGYSSANSSWLVTGGTLPTGLTLSADGVLSGKPTVASAGANFTVQAAYKLKTGQQAYTIVVSGVALQVTSITTGTSHTCAVTTAGAAKCWGYNYDGQLGDGTKVTRLTPVAVSGLTSGVASITAGAFSTCAVTTAGAAKCWGANDYGQLGDGSSVGKATPVDVFGLTSGVASMTSGTDAGPSYATCAVTTAGAAKCWGYNAYGQLGDGTTVDKSTPVAVSGLASGVASMTTGTGHTCAVTTAGAAKCWGKGYSGELGDGTTVSKSTPVTVSGLASGVASIVAGANHTCAVTTAGAVMCWGWNGYGNLGDGTTVAKSTPVTVSGLASGAASISSSGNHACAVTTAGAAKCWGYNYSGQLGDGTKVNKGIPVAVSGLTSGVTSITAGAEHTCAVTPAGGAKCWGANGFGQLGDSTTVAKSTPVAVLP